MLSMAIHFIGRRTFDSCRKYFRWYISSVRPKSATLITPLAATLYSEANHIMTMLMINSHAVSSRKVSVHKQL